ncbi:hypothetical protein EJ03DRAFT_332367 [Teratosphaeria nubilosa]|uniref:Raptor N-terminal CASPase-like domain-containing protein n=1 Tax=Teratosphaeria nubilosa TaxID=161662 RepID=A0A6G1KU75_9PEZI|nr:hypothetical protein EJ03DRAFT_332367 [Teratosphaeria nubilosa]
MGSRDMNGYFGAVQHHPRPVLHALPTTDQHPTIHASRPQSSPSHAQPNGHHHQPRNQGSNSDSEDGGLEIQRRRSGAQRPATLSRAHSDAAQGSARRIANGHNENRKAQQRHGWQLEQETAAMLSQHFFMYFEDKRHETAGNPPPDYDPLTLVSEWRMKDRLKTVSAILAVCLNVGVDPPDVIKTNPCARLECWVDPQPPESSNSQSSNNTNQQIGKNLQSQYENLSLRTRYKVIMDPTIDELKRYTTGLRRTAHQERILFHYNGHGVPKPTASGEVWCFNRSYTQYIPVSLGDIQEWVGAPGLWVWDCSAAGGIIAGFLEAAAKHAQAQADALRRDPSRAQQGTLTRWEDSIHLAACRENEVLPTNPKLPADIFTSCLTTPIAMAVRFFLLQNPLPSTSTIDLNTARNIPGKVSERRTPLGELNWIFTAITDTIAWNCLPKPLFKKLFRQDLMVAALFRNFLLAQRVMRIYHCHPQSHPAIPDTHNHPLWKSWDLAVEMILAQLPKLNEQVKAQEALAEMHAQGQPNGSGPAPPAPPIELDYTHSTFFADQLSAFDVYLTSSPNTHSKPPEQLPIVLQVLLSQVHRLRALILLSKFLDLGPWAVNLALSIGIFPYVLKLLQSQAIELKPPMVFIWARILAVDQSCQGDLLKDSGYTYFTNILNHTSALTPPNPNGSGNMVIPLGNLAEHRAMCAFVIAMFCKDFKPGKQAVLETNPEIIECLLGNLGDMENPLLRQFSCLCLSHLWKDFPPAKALGMEVQAHARVRDRSHDPVPEVRAACLDALTSFVGTVSGNQGGGVSDGIMDAGVVLEEETLASVVISMGMDGSIMVRKELTVFYSSFIKKYEKRMAVAAWEQLLEERDKRWGKADGEADTETPEDKAESSFIYGDGTTNGADLPLKGSASHRRSVSFTAQDSDLAGTAAASSKASRTLSKKTIYRAMWRQTLSMSADPHPEVARNASVVVDYIINALLDSPLGEFANKILDEIVIQGLKRDHAVLNSMDGLSKQRSRDGTDSLGRASSWRPDTPPSPTASTASTRASIGGDGYFALSRTASVAAAMKNFFSGGSGRTPAASDAGFDSPTKSHRTSISGRDSQSGAGSGRYNSRPLTPGDAELLPPDALDKFQGPEHQPKAPIPPSPYFVPRDLSMPPEIPLKSHFFTWSSTYFREPQMHPPESDEPGSLDYNERLWRRNRNDRIIASTQPLKEAAGSQRWDIPAGYFGVGAAPYKMVFHQFEDHLVTSDDRDSIAVWDWRRKEQLNRFSNGNPEGSRVTELRFINEDDQAMLMVGSSDGVIKIYRSYESPKRMQLATAFRALSDLVSSSGGSAGLVFDWQQGQGRVLVAGDDRVVRVWQAGHELCVTDIPARSGSCITSLTSDQVEGNVFVAGFGNGSVRAYDQRMGSRDSMIMDWVDRTTGHRSWVVGVHLQRGGLRELVSAESNGGVRLWDIRMRKPLSTLPGSPQTPRNLRSLSVHEHAPVFATGSSDHTIRVYNTSELRRLSTAEPYMSYLRTAIVGGGAGLHGSRAAPITAMAFHPHRTLLACGAVNDGHVNLFRCEATEKEDGKGVSRVVEEWRA